MGCIQLWEKKKKPKMHTSGPVNMDTAEKDRAKEKHRISKSKCVKRP